MSSEKYTIEEELGISTMATKLVLALMAGQGGKFNKLISSNCLAFLLGGKGKWSAYRHKTMENLEYSGLVYCIKLAEGKRRTWHYSFTDTASDQLKEMLGIKS